MRRTPAHEALALDQQLCFQLYSASRLMTRVYKPLLEPLGLTYPQYLVMLVLWERAALGHAPSVMELGARLRLDSGTLTPLLKRLEQSGLVVRKRDEADERVVRISLSEAGAVLEDRALEVPFTLLCKTQVELPEVLALRERLGALVEALEASVDEMEAT